MSERAAGGLIRTTSGFLLSPVMPCVLYTWLFWGQAFFPMIYLVIFLAYALSLFILVPAYLALFYRHQFNLYSSSFLSFAVLFLTFFIFF